MMKKVLVGFAISLFAVTAASADNEPPPAANIKVSPDWGKAQCAAQPGLGITIIWDGVEDKRSNPVVGMLKKKKEEFEVKLAATVDATIGEAVKTVFSNCGFAVETKKEAAGVVTSVEVVEFFAGAKKGFLTGETDAKGSLVLHFNKAGGTYDFNLGATKSDKRLKKRDIKQLEEVLTGLLESLAIQIVESPQLFEEVKKIAGR